MHDDIHSSTTTNLEMIWVDDRKPNTYQIEWKLLATVLNEDQMPQIKALHKHVKCMMSTEKAFTSQFSVHVPFLSCHVWRQHTISRVHLSGKSEKREREREKPKGCYIRDACLSLSSHFLCRIFSCVLINVRLLLALIMWNDMRSLIHLTRRPIQHWSSICVSKWVSVCAVIMMKINVS